jgi:hypothetical protein
MYLFIPRKAIFWLILRPAKPMQVSMRNYFNPARITDLKERTIEAVTEIKKNI